MWSILISRCEINEIFRFAQYDDDLEIASYHTSTWLPQYVILNECEESLSSLRNFTPINAAILAQTYSNAVNKGLFEIFRFAQYDDDLEIASYHTSTWLPQYVILNECEESLSSLRNFTPINAAILAQTYSNAVNKGLFEIFRFAQYDDDLEIASYHTSTWLQS